MTNRRSTNPFSSGLLLSLYRSVLEKEPGLSMERFLKSNNLLPEEIPEETYDSFYDANPLDVTIPMIKKKTYPESTTTKEVPPKAAEVCKIEKEVKKEEPKVEAPQEIEENFEGAFEPEPPTVDEIIDSYIGPSDEKFEDSFEDEPLTPKVENIDFRPVEKKKVEEKSLFESFLESNAKAVYVEDAGKTSVLIEERKKTLNSRTEQVYATGSMYSATISALNLSERIALRNAMTSNKDLYTRLVKTLHEKIVSMNPPKPSFEAFTQVTSFTDLDVLLAGLYSSTYLNSEQSIDLGCSANGCNHKETVNFKPKDLQVVNSLERAVERMSEIEKMSSLEDSFSKGVLSRRKSVALKQLKALLVLKLPSISDFLKSLNVKASEQDVSDVSMFIDSISLFDEKESVNQKRPVFIKLKHSNFSEVIRNLDPADLKDTANAIDEMSDDLRVEFKIPAFTCSKCGTENKSRPVKIQDLFFLELSKA